MYSRFLAAAVAVAIIIGIGYLVRWQPAPLETRGSGSSSSSSSSASPASASVIPATGAAPQLTYVKDAAGTVLATFTKGSRTVVMHGPSRTFAEPENTDTTVTTSDWVRISPTVFSGAIDQVWLAQATALNNNQVSSSPDMIQIAMQYIIKAPLLKDVGGKVIAGDASYGPLQTDGQRQEGSDFNDFVGIPYTYGNVVDQPEVAQRGDLDCSGFQRMIWGYRGGLALELNPTGKAIPRRAYQIFQSAPGVDVVPSTGLQVNDFSRLQTGDIVFHDASTNDGTQIDHLGMYLGLDSQGSHRFISSRKTADGPTFGDRGGKSILDGNGLYAKSFRAVRRF